MIETPKKRGRPKGTQKDGALEFDTVGLTPERWQIIEKWIPGGKVNKGIQGANRTGGLNALIDRVEKFGWSEGPETRPPSPKPGQIRKTTAISRHAKENGITEAELLNMMWEVYKKNK